MQGLAQKFDFEKKPFSAKNQAIFHASDSARAISKAIYVCIFQDLSYLCINSVRIWALLMALNDTFKL
jgi:hypothetical protein